MPQNGLRQSQSQEDSSIVRWVQTSPMWRSWTSGSHGWGIDAAAAAENWWFMHVAQNSLHSWLDFDADVNIG